MCPMFWCRESFQDEQSTLAHIARCSWVADTWYWCPQCGRQETYLGGVATQVQPRQIFPNPKESRLRKAISYLKHLGCAGSTKSRASSSRFQIQKSELANSFSPAATVFGDDGQLYNNTCYSLNMELPEWHNLNAQYETPILNEKDPTAFSLNSEPQTGLNRIAEQNPFDSVFRILEETAYMYQSAELVDGLPNSDDISLPDHCQDIQDLSKPETYSLDLSMCAAPSALPSQLTLDPLTLESQISPFSNPLSERVPSIKTFPKRPEPICCQAEDRRQLFAAIIKSAYDESGEHNLIGLESQFWEGPSSTEARSSQWTPHDGCEDYSSGEDLTPMQMTVQELRKIVDVTNRAWRDRLVDSPNVVLMCSAIPAHTLFESGISALQRIFSGTLVDTFADIFALLHVAFALNYSQHINDTAYCWDTFFQEMLWWAFVIKEGNEACSFRDILHKISPSTDISHLHYAGFSSESASSSKLFEFLRNSRIMKDCSDFLDGKAIYETDPDTVC